MRDSLYSSFIPTIPTLALLLLGCFIMTATAQPTNAQESQKDQNRVLDIQAHQTPGGIAFWHVEDHSLPIIAMHFAFRGAGSVNDPADKIGLGQLVSNTIDEGAGERDAQAFQAALEDHAIELSFNNNRDHFTGKLKTLTRHQDLAFDLLRDALHAPRFEEEAVNRMRAANISRIQSSQARPNWMAARLMNDIYYGDHPYARNSGGTISGLQAITAADMHDFVKRMMARDNLIVSMAGDLTADQAARVIDHLFADLPATATIMSLAQVTPPATPVKKAFEKDSPQSVVQMVWPAFTKSDADYHALRVMNHILGGGGFSSLLMDEVREQQGLTYGIYSQPLHMDYADYLVIESATSPDNIAPMTASVQDILTRLKTDLVDDQTLTDAQNYLIGSLPLRFSSTLSLSGAAIRMQLDGRPIDALDQWDDKIAAVTAEDVQRVANRIFTTTDPIVTVIAGAVPEGQGFDTVETIPGIE